MLTKQERREIAERAKEYKKEEEQLSWDQFSYVLLGIQSWRSDDELLDRIVELCEAVNVDELAFRPSADEMYLQALNVKHERIAAYVEADSYVNIKHIISCIEDFDAAISHYKRLVERSNNAN
ncbi:hypothetical protein Apar_0557 [Lancefieldella parvula DSM 20469]|uniref:Uncharacterized protein n=2 Tax=Lancefieldella parvula TaxID=1382 RepID=C8WA49_LANP1|nr:hypothetical protein Apar_0557 [Lancefieldella parvula DSM 20469]